MKNILILFILTFVFSMKGFSQNDVSVSLGLGLPELLNAGVRYEMAPVKFGAGIGTAFTGYALSGDFYYHFGKLSQYSELPPWYIRANMTYWQLRKVLFIDLGRVVLLGIRAGRDFNVSETFGVNIDGGIIPFSFFSGKKIPFSFIPTAGVSVYYRLGAEPGRGHRAQSTGHRALSTRHRADGRWQSVKNEEQRVQGREHRAKSEELSKHVSSVR